MAGSGTALGGRLRASRRRPMPVAGVATDRLSPQMAVLMMACTRMLQLVKGEPGV